MQPQRLLESRYIEIGLESQGYQWPKGEIGLAMADHFAIKISFPPHRKKDQGGNSIDSTFAPKMAQKKHRTPRAKEVKRDHFIPVRRCPFQTQNCDN